MDLHDILLTALIFGAALLYASVGHAGASGYLAAMALMGVAPSRDEAYRFITECLSGSRRNISLLPRWRFFTSLVLAARGGLYSTRLHWWHVVVA